MRTLFLFLSLSWFSLAATARDKHVINAIAGDESFVQRFGRTPNLFDDPTLRVYTHLHWVEEKLRAVSTSNLSNDQRIHRAYLLDQLHAYTEAQRFPKNKKYRDENCPCFIDDDGSICAVGYLIEQSSGRALAEKINARFQYDFIADMHDIDLENWISWSGLSAKECALIQPEYIAWHSASFEYGNDSLIRYLQKNITANDSADHATISFHVNASGKAKNFSCEGNAALAKSAERLLKNLQYRPGGPGMMWSGGDVHRQQKSERFVIRLRGAMQENNTNNTLQVVNLQKADTSLRNITINGTISDQASGESIPFCTVILRSAGTILQNVQTDFDGKFRLKIDKYQPNLNLGIQYVGYANQTFSVPWNNQDIRIQLKQADEYQRRDLSDVGEILLPVKK